MLYAVTSGLQAALMVPTEVLAAQHARTLHRLLAPLGISSVLLTSSVTGSERRRTLERLADGSAQIAIGTHALIQKDVNFKALTMVVVDEQHRFGVLQRATLRTKGTTPDILIMTATPIPRTLGLTVFGDLDVSVIDELPPGRRPITTRVIFARQRDKLYQQIAHEAAAGRQIYIIYPLVEESESVDLQAATVAAEELRTNVFPGIRIGLLHGRMKHEEKQAVLQAFSAGQVPVLVSTTVIEVGIDVANATIMVIENAERFGMAQLHQLRGRVGRGVWPSYCYLVAGEKVTEMAKRRLKALEQSQDGFRIAEEDLAIRGPGEFLGTRQAGQVDGTLLAIIRHPDLLDLARNDAERLLQRVVEARKPLPDPLLVELRRAWRDRFALMTVG